MIIYWWWGIHNIIEYGWELQKQSNRNLNILDKCALHSSYYLFMRLLWQSLHFMYSHYILWHCYCYGAATCVTYEWRKQRRLTHASYVWRRQRRKRSMRFSINGAGSGILFSSSWDSVGDTEFNKGLSGRLSSDRNSAGDWVQPGTQ